MFMARLMEVLFILVSFIAFFDFRSRGSSFQNSVVLFCVDVEWFIL